MPNIGKIVDTGITREGCSIRIRRPQENKRLWVLETFERGSNLKRLEWWVSGAYATLKQARAGMARLS